MRRNLNIFVQYASQLLTDHQSHGDGLICFSLLNGLAERGHRIFAYSDNVRIQRCHPNLVTKECHSRSPVAVLRPWEHAWRAERWFRQLRRTNPFDLTWRMHPYGTASPWLPQHENIPWVIGPLFYEWPESNNQSRPTSRFLISGTRLLRPLAKRGWETGLQKASLILCATPEHVRSMQNRYPKSQVEELPVIVDTTRESTWPRTMNARLRLAFVSNLVAYKNPIMFCRLVGLLIQSGITVHATVVGDGPEKQALMQWTADHGCAEAVTFLGRIPNQDVYRLLKESDVFISASVGEPYGRSIVESMSVGTPVVCHRSGGPAELVSHGSDGFLVDEVTPQAYHAEVLKLVNNPAFWQEMSESARKKSEQWSSQAVIDRLEQLLADTASNAGSRKG